MRGREDLERDLDEVLIHADAIWPQLRGGRIFMSGGTGFIGKWLAQSFVAANKRYALGAGMTLLSRDPGRFARELPWVCADPAITLHAGDVRTFEYPAGGFTHVMHGAAEVSLAADPVDTFDVAVQGTRRVLEFARARGVHSCLLLSSGAVYGRQPADLERVGEDCPNAPDTLIPASAYGEGKRAAEWLCAAYGGQGGLRCKIARCFALIGPHIPLDGRFAVGNFVRDCVAGEPVRILGDGTAMRSYLYAGDLAAWLWTILVNGSSGHAYNVGSEAGISIGELAALVAGLSAKRPTVLIAQSPVPGKAPERYVPSTAKARDELGLSAWLPLEESIVRTLAWAGDRGADMERKSHGAH
jgi:nucleoside-diphosphate-sugar epimerase